MKKIVWKNRSNGQLCVTIPSGSGIRDGDIVSLSKEKIRTVVYTPITADLFHFGQLRVLQAANALGDFHICGVLTDAGIRAYKGQPIATHKERTAVVSCLNCVDMVMAQDSLDPTKNLMLVHRQFPNAKIILVIGSNWKKVPGAAYMRRIKGRIVQPPFYERLSTENIIRRIRKLYANR